MIWQWRYSTARCDFGELGDSDDIATAMVTAMSDGRFEDTDIDR